MYLVAMFSRVLFWPSDHLGSVESLYLRQNHTYVITQRASGIHAAVQQL